MRDIYIVRHGNTFDKGDVVTRVGARTDLPLSLSGQAQADALAAHFSVSVSGFEKIYCSPLKRTRETAAAILSQQASDAYDLEALEFLREIDYGPDENQPESTVLARIGQDALTAWENHAVPPDGWQVNPQQIIAAWKDLFTQIARLPLPETGPAMPVLIVTSNGVARFALQAANDTNGYELKLKTGAYGIVRVQTIDNKTHAHVLDWNLRPVPSDS